MPAGEHPTDRAERRPVVLLWFVAAAVTFWSFGFHVLRGSDLWWHLAGGRWTLAHGFPALADPFSFTAFGSRWVNDAWLSDLLLFLWARAFGTASLVWWKWGVIAATWTILFRAARRVGAGASLPAWLACLIGVAAAAPFLDLRPHLHSFLCFALLLELTLGRTSPSRLLPLLFLVWVNLHAGFVLGVVALPVLLAPAFLRGDRRTRLRLAALASACLLACLLNPNGVAALSRPLRYALNPASPFRSIAEWRTPFAPGGIRSPLFPLATAALGAALVAAAIRRREGPAPSLPAAALALLTLAMALRSRRFIPLFCLAQVGVTAPVLAALGRRALRARTVLPAALALAFGVVRLLPFPLSAEVAFHYLEVEDSFPVDTLDFAGRNRLEGDVFAWYGYGGYVLWRAHGRLRVYIDGRADAAYGGRTLVEYGRVQARAPGWIATVEDSGARYFLWPRRPGRHAEELLATGRWRRLHRDAVSTLLVRVGREPVVTAAAPDTPWRDVSVAVDLLTQGDGAGATVHLERALARMPHLRIAREALVRARALAGDAEGSRRALEEAYRLFPYPGRREALERAFPGVMR